MTTIAPPIPEPAIPFLLRLLGARFRDGKNSYRMRWGELSFNRPGWALQLHLFGDDTHFSLHVHAWRLFNAYIRLRFLQRFAREPEEMMESWGVSYSCEPNQLWLRWGSRYRIVDMPWHDWRHVSSEVLLSDRSWAPRIYSYDRGGEPADRRHLESYPYRYLTRAGERQVVTATIFVTRMTWRLKWLRWTHAFDRVRTYIDIAFSDEVGERRGSWKGGTIGCSYELRPNETPLECLRRMEQERRFS